MSDPLTDSRSFDDGDSSSGDARMVLPSNWEKRGFFSGEPVRVAKPARIPPPKPKKDEEEAAADGADQTDGREC